jgi:hypothetical protein
VNLSHIPKFEILGCDTCSGSDTTGRHEEGVAAVARVVRPRVAHERATHFCYYSLLCLLFKINIFYLLLMMRIRNQLKLQCTLKWIKQSISKLATYLDLTSNRYLGHTNNILIDTTEDILIHTNMMIGQGYTIQPG